MAARVAKPPSSFQLQRVDLATRRRELLRLQCGRQRSLANAGADLFSGSAEGGCELNAACCRAAATTAVPGELLTPRHRRQFSLRTAASRQASKKTRSQRPKCRRGDLPIYLSLAP